MDLFRLFLMLGAISFGSGAAFYPLQRAELTSVPSTDCAPPVTVTTVVTISYPTFITVASPDWASISSSLSYVASVDTVQVSDSSELLPLSETPAPTTPTFVHSILAPGYTASEVSNGNSSVYFVSVGPNTTLWNYSPTSPLPVTIGLTTVTVLPVQPTSSASPVVTVNSTVYTTNVTSTIYRSTLVTVTASGHNGFTSNSSGWNVTQSTNSSASAGTENTALSILTITDIAPASTTTLNVTVYPTYSSTDNYTGFGYPKKTTTSLSAIVTEDTFGRRQVSSPSGVCTLIFATIGGHLASWCNNWDGSTPVTVPTYTTTITPYPPSGNTPPPSTVTVSVTASINTVTNSIAITPSKVPPPSVAPGPSSVVASSTSVAVSAGTGSSTASAPSSVPSCGEEGNFEINFDDLPAYSPPNNDTAPVPPIFNPYHHFFWGNGWGYVPPPTDPFPPQSGDHLAEYVPGQENNDTGSPDAGLVPDSAFGCGPRAYDDNFWFNAQSVYVGCDNGATDSGIQCDFVATGYQWDAASQQEQVVVTEHFPQPPCPNFVNCTLQQIFFGSQFTMLTSLSFYANVQGQLKIYWVDTIELSWWNNTCAAGLNRIRQE